MRSLLFSAVVSLGLAVGVGGCASTMDGTDGGGSTGGTPGIAGSWSTAGALATSLQLNLQASGSSITGSGTLGVPALAPISGPATPTYTGDSLTITSGTFGSDSSVSVTAQLGANPNGSGGFYYGTFSFSGTLANGTLAGMVSYTPPRTASQVFAAQTIASVTLTKR